MRPEAEQLPTQVEKERKTVLKALGLVIQESASGYKVTSKFTLPPTTTRLWQSQNITSCVSCWQANHQDQATLGKRRMGLGLSGRSEEAVVTPLVLPPMRCALSRDSEGGTGEVSCTAQSHTPVGLEQR